MHLRRSSCMASALADADDGVVKTLASAVPRTVAGLCDEVEDQCGVSRRLWRGEEGVGVEVCREEVT